MTYSVTRALHSGAWPGFPESSTQPLRLRLSRGAFARAALESDTVAIRSGDFG